MPAFANLKELKQIRKVNISLMFVLLALAVSVFTGCGESSGSQPCTVIFIANGGTPAVPSEQVNCGGTVAAPTATLTRAGYDFEGWYGNSGLTIRVTFPVTVTLQNTYFFAKWTLRPYTVTFDSNGGDDILPVEAERGETLPEPDPEPMRAGYDLEGWYSDSGLTESVTFPYTVMQDITLYAKWVPINEFARKVTFREQTATVDFSNLRNNDIYLVKVNTSDSVVNAGDTGRVVGNLILSFEADWNNERLYARDKALPPWLADIHEFNANPPPIVDKMLYETQSVFVPPIVGDKRMFWVGYGWDSGRVQKQATLMATGRHGNIWVLDENLPGNVDITAEAEMAAAQFDLIYPAATNLLGFEYGGGPGNGGRDGDPKIQILFYDMIGAVGYVSFIDYYHNIQVSSSNMAEIFYVHSSYLTGTGTLDNKRYNVTRIMIHEFQHLIGVNQKFAKHGISPFAWYNEMLSTMAEDAIILSIGGVSVNAPSPVRVHGFLGSYDQIGVTEIGELGLGYGYSSVSVFGAYLMRNFGGAELLKNILANDKNGIDSITAALNEYSAGLTFEKALARFGEAMIFSGSRMPENVLTLDETVTSHINGIRYTVRGFNIYDIIGSGLTQRGPRIFDLNPKDMRPHSALLHSTDGWKNRSGRFSITLEKPADPNIILYLMVK